MDAVVVMAAGVAGVKAGVGASPPTGAPEAAAAAAAAAAEAGLAAAGVGAGARGAVCISTQNPLFYITEKEIGLLKRERAKYG